MFRCRYRYVNTDTIHVSDSDEDHGMPQNQTEETLLSYGPGDDSGATSGEQKARDGYSSSDKDNDQSTLSGRMGKLFGNIKKKNTKEKSTEKDNKGDKEKKRGAKREEKEEKIEKREKEKKNKTSKKDKEKKDEEKEKDKPKSRPQQRMPGFGKLGGFFKKNKKDSNTSNDSDITPPKQTSTPPPHTYTDDVARDISSDVPHDQTFPLSEHSGATSAAANSDVFDEQEKVPLDEMDPRTRFGGPPPESIPMMGEPLGYVPPPMVPISETYIPSVHADTTAPKALQQSYTKTMPSVADKMRAPFNKLLVNKRPPKFQRGDGIAELNPETPSSLVRCSTFITAVLLSGFLFGIILTAMGSLSDTLAVIGPCFIGKY